MLFFEADLGFYEQIKKAIIIKDDVSYEPIDYPLVFTDTNMIKPQLYTDMISAILSHNIKLIKKEFDNVFMKAYTDSISFIDINHNIFRFTIEDYVFQELSLILHSMIYNRDIQVPQTVYDMEMMSGVIYIQYCFYEEWISFEEDRKNNLFDKVIYDDREIITTVTFQDKEYNKDSFKELFFDYYDFIFNDMKRIAETKSARK